MDPPLLERLRWRNPTGNDVEWLASRATMGRTAAVLSGAIAITCLVGALIPGDAQRDDDLLIATAAAAAVLGAVLLMAYDRLPFWAFHGVALLGTALSTAAAYGWGSESAYGPLPYVWVTLFVFYFFNRTAALLHVALMAAGYALVLVEESPSEDPLDGWIATVATLLVTGYLISIAHDRLTRLIASLSDAAHRDPLTNLLNRRGFQEVFDLELERARRADQPLSLIVGDLDRFKRVNDAHGHAAGDAVLRRVADAIRGAKRGFDRAARVGGEEFAVLAPDADENGAYMLAERIRAAVHEADSSCPRAGSATSCPPASRTYCPVSGSTTNVGVNRISPTRRPRRSRSASGSPRTRSMASRPMACCAQPTRLSTPPSASAATAP